MRDAIALMTEAAEELDAYYAQEYAGDHPYSVRKLVQAKEENPARAALTALQEPAPVGVGDDDGSLRWAALRLAQEAEIDGMADRAGWDCWVALVKSRSALQPSSAVKCTYTNYRGETATRRISPISVRFGSTEWHPEEQWLLLAFDHDKQAEREFAFSGFAQPAPAREEMRDYGKMMQPPADATHCGGYPVNPPAREEVREKVWGDALTVAARCAERRGSPEIAQAIRNLIPRDPS
jgi:hypothetical protein